MASEPRIRFKNGKWKCFILSKKVWEENPTHRHFSFGSTPVEAFREWQQLGRLNMQSQMRRSHLALACSLANDQSRSLSAAPSGYQFISGLRPLSRRRWWHRIDWWRVLGRACMLAGAAAVVAALAGCDKVVAPAGENSTSALTRFVDKENGVICYQDAGFRQAFSCVKVPGGGGGDEERASGSR